MATFDDSGIFPEQSLYFLFNNRSGNISFKYLLGILNSSFVTFYYRAILVRSLFKTRVSVSHAAHRV